MPLFATFIMLASGIPVALSEQQLNVPFSLGRGWASYQANCVSCHGVQGGGTDKGPPLIHKYYVPSHHSDASIIRAIRHGTKQHHWKFGNMAPISGIGEEEAKQITQFVRWLQREKGLLPK